MADAYCDSTTIFPDHFAARISASAIATMLVRRLRTGAGGRVSVSQAETIFGAMSTSFLHEFLQPGTFLPSGNQDLYNAPSNVFACSGDDEWCVVSVENSAHWRQLCVAIDKSQWLDSPQFASVELSWPPYARASTE